MMGGLVNALVVIVEETVDVSVQGKEYEVVARLSMAISLSMLQEAFNFHTFLRM